MADAIADIARYIDNERRNLEKNMSELGARATAAVDWREHVRRHPGLTMAAALGGGVLLAQMGGRTRRRSASSWGDHAYIMDQQERTDTAPNPFDPIIAAVFAAATSALAGVLVDALSVPLGTARSASPR